MPHKILSAIYGVIEMLLFTYISTKEVMEETYAKNVMN